MASSFSRLQSDGLLRLGYLLSKKVYENRQEKFAALELKDKIQQSCEEIELEDIRKSISQWKKRLRLACDENGGPIEHLYKNLSGKLLHLSNLRIHRCI